MKTLHHLSAILLAVPVFGVSVYIALEDPTQLNPWHPSDGPLDFNLWYLVLPQMVCSLGIILLELIALRTSRKPTAKRSETM